LELPGATSLLSQQLLLRPDNDIYVFEECWQEPAAARAIKRVMAEITDAVVATLPGFVGDACFRDSFTNSANDAFSSAR
jgi:hypothetical protein